MSRLYLGCIADDFTGATDLASNLVRGGLRVVQTMGVPTQPLDEPADAVVVACGSYTAGLLRGVGVHLPIYPGKGYSATFRILQPERAPWVSTIDDEVKCAMSRLGDHLRVAGTIELGGFDLSLDTPVARARCEMLARRIEQVLIASDGQLMLLAVQNHGQRNLASGERHSRDPASRFAHAFQRTQRHVDALASRQHDESDDADDEEQLEQGDARHHPVDGRGG